MWVRCRFLDTAIDGWKLAAAVCCVNELSLYCRSRLTCEISTRREHIVKSVCSVL